MLITLKHIHNSPEERPDNKMPKVIFVDWRDTLSGSLFWGHLSSPSSAGHRMYAQIEEWLFHSNRALLTSWMKGERTTKDVIGEMSKGINYAREIIEQELITSCRNMQFADSTFPSLISKIRKRGTSVVVATDNMPPFRDHTIPAMRLGALFDGFLISSELGYVKDDGNEDGIPFFDQYLADHNLTYSDAVLIDDSPDSTGQYAARQFERIQISGPDDVVKVLGYYATA